VGSAFSRFYLAISGHILGMPIYYTPSIKSSVQSKNVNNQWASLLSRLLVLVGLFESIVGLLSVMGYED
jgi:hypothetical protein